jgi:colanic acid/amylovoran biosynthesis glycosyltransferase
VRVAFVLSRFPVRSQTFVINQITGLIARGVDVEILAGNPTEPILGSDSAIEQGLLARTRWVNVAPSVPGQLAQSLRGAGRMLARDPRMLAGALDVRRFGFAAASGRLLAMAQGLPRGLRYDVVHAHFGPSGIMAMALRELGVLEGKVSTVFHGFDMTEVMRLFGRGYYARLFARGDLFLPISEHWRARLLQLGAPPSHTHVHRMGIDLQRFAPPSPRGSRSRPLRLLSVGRLVEKKGFGDAIAAIAALPPGLDVQYQIAGEGPLEPALRATIAQRGVAGRIELLGALDHEQVRRAMLEADALLAPSVTARNGDQEGIPVTIMEAMAMELPVIATRHSGIPELVADGVSGLLADERDPAGLARHIERLARDADLRLAFGRAGREIVLREYDIEQLNDRLLARFRALAEA